MKKNILYNFLLIIFSVLFTLIFFEFILRSGLIENRLYNQMLYDGEVNNPKYKILILGDSFIAEESGLYELLVKDLGTYKVKILNTAELGSGPFHYLAEMKMKGVPFKPDIVLLFYYVGNDLTGVQYSFDLKNRIKNFLRPIIRRLYTYDFIKGKIQSLQLHFVDYNKIEKSGVDPDMISLAKEEKINPFLLEASTRNRNYVLDNVLMETKENMRAWKKVERILTDIDTICKKINSKFIIIILPSTVQVDKTNLTFLKKCNFMVDERTLFSNKPQRLIKEFCRDKGILCLDILPYFKAENNIQFYKTNDDHFSEEGKMFSEKIIFNFVVKNCYLK